MLDTSAIHRAVATTRRRLKLQSALEWATLLSIAASAVTTAAVVSARLGWIPETSAIGLVAIAAGLIVIGAVAGYLRPFNRNMVATRLDRSADLADRMASALAFETLLDRGETAEGHTDAMMRLAILDATRMVNKADPKAASPFHRPKDGKAAVAFALVAALVCGISLNNEIEKPTLAMLAPAQGAPGSIVIATGTRLLAPSGAADTAVFFGEGETAIAAKIRDISGKSIEFEVPAAAPIGMTVVTVRAGMHKTNSLPFEVLAEDDPRAIPEDHIVLEDEDLDFVKDLVAELREAAEANEDLELEELAKEIQELVGEAEKGKLSKKELLEALAKAEEKYMEGSEEAVEEAVSDLKKAGKELKKDKLTKELGKALEKGDLDKAKAEMEKLAKQIEDNKVADKDMQKLGKAMEKAADKMQKAEDKRKQAMDKRIAKQQEAVRQLQKKKDENKDEKRDEEMVRRLQKEKRELKRLQRNKEEQEKDKSKRELKQLRRNMKKTAQQMQKQDKKNQQKSRREVSKSMRDMAKRTGKVSQDKRKMANKQKVTTQMSDLKEAMRRAKRKGKKGPNNKFGRNKARKRDFGSRARGGKGQKGAWKPGQGQGQGQGKKPGQGQGQGQGQGTKPGGKQYGDSHDPNVMGDPTRMSGNTKDESLQGLHGKGPSTRETILTAAQKGFASRSYKDVYVRYKTIVEEVIKAEKVPPGYKHYVKRYFHQIKPK